MIRTSHVSLTNSAHAPKTSIGLEQLPKDIVLDIAEKAGPAGFSKVALLSKRYNAVIKTALIEGSLQKFSPSDLQQKIDTRVTAMYDGKVREIVKPLVDRALVLSEAWKAAPTHQKRLDYFGQLSHVARSVYDVHTEQVNGDIFKKSATVTGACLGCVGGPAGTTAWIYAAGSVKLFSSALVGMFFMYPGILTGAAVGLCVGHSTAYVSATLAQTLARQTVKNTLAKLDNATGHNIETAPADIEMQRM